MYEDLLEYSRQINQAARAMEAAFGPNQAFSILEESFKSSIKERKRWAASYQADFADVMQLSRNIESQIAAIGLDKINVASSFDPIKAMGNLQLPSLPSQPAEVAIETLCRRFVRFQKETPPQEGMRAALFAVIGSREVEVERISKKSGMLIEFECADGTRQVVSCGQLNVYFANVPDEATRRRPGFTPGT